MGKYHVSSGGVLARRLLLDPSQLLALNSGEDGDRVQIENPSFTPRKRGSRGLPMEMRFPQWSCSTAAMGQGSTDLRSAGLSGSVRAYLSW
jgi:hypothetical protein